MTADSSKYVAERSEPKGGWGFWVATMVGVLATLLLLWGSGIPLGVPGEWSWQRIRLDEDQVLDVVLGVVAAVIAAAVYIGTAWLGAHRVARCSPAERAGWLTALVAAGFSWLWVVQECPPVEYGLAKAPHVLFYPGSSGYFYTARYEMDDVPSFLAGYEELMAQGDVLHVGTHPPGLFLLHRGLIVFCRKFPALADLILQTQPQSVDRAFAIIEETSADRPRRFVTADRAPLWLAALLTQLVGVATLVPLYWLIGLDHSKQAAWQAAVFWPLVPALAVFLPKSDALYPFIGTLFLVLWLTGCRRRSEAWCFTAGLVFWAGMFLSLALLPVGLLAAIISIWEATCVTTKERSEPLSLRLGYVIYCGSLTISAVAVLFLPLALIYELHVFIVWAQNYSNHAAFYMQPEFHRTYWQWLLVNPLELVLSLGTPLVVLVVASFRRPSVRGFKSPHWPCAIVWGLLWLSGKNMGEAARLWLFLMPWAAWLAADWFETTGSNADRNRSPLPGWLVLLALQAAVCLATVTRVYGFDVLGAAD